ncbi:MAG: queuosine precursor transporter [Treponemataceae bacterium]|nr:queuosine precursor transporter [Treponemataceae bacterium]
MPNEALLILSLLFSFGALVAALKFFGKAGVYAWIAVCAVLANIEVTVLVHAFGMDQTLGNTLFASSFLATDILSEIYGKKSASKGVLIGIFTTVVFIIFSNLWIRYSPAPEDWAMPSVIALFSNTPRILTASLAGYAVSELLDVRLYHLWWSMTERRSGGRKGFLWFRNNCSTLISQFVNIVLFNFGAFFGVFEFRQLVQITISCYVIYIVTSLLDTPFVYLARSIHRPEAGGDGR